MKKLSILLVLFLASAFAGERFQDNEKKEFMNDIKADVAEQKIRNKGRIDLQILKTGLYQELETYLDQKKITSEELVRIKQNYENFSRDLSDAGPDKIEANYYRFIEQEFERVNRVALGKAEEGSLCNARACANGLVCAPSPDQKAVGKGREGGERCQENADCASFDCVEEKAGSRHKVCEEVYRCFRPLGAGEACLNNPVCSVGKCLPYDSMTSGIGECEVKGKSCKKNGDCCSNLCGGGVCRENKICKDCVSKGARPARGQRCCEGLYMNASGMCVPDVPPSVIPQVRISPLKNALMIAVQWLLPAAHAEVKSEVQKANQEMKDTIKVEKELYTNFKAKSDKGDAVDMKKVSANLNFSKKSDFKTCDIRFKEDYYGELKKQKTFDLEVAMLGFGFVMLGNADNDYWRSGSGENTSLYGRLKAIALERQNVRKKTNDKINEINNKLTCICLDVQGYEKIASKEKKDFFEKNCEEYKTYLNSKTTATTSGTSGITPAELNFAQMSDDASGLKGKMLLTVWTEKLDELYTTLTMDNEKTFSSFAEVARWANEEAKWSEARHREYELFKFNIKGPSYSATALGALTTALLAAGAIAILGGFATTSLLSAWGAAGIIAASAVSGAGGMWMVASLKGAWLTKNPEIIDTNQRGYNCGKNESCVEYTRVLKQPYNDVCKIHASANSCIVNFVVAGDGQQSEYIVDPWIPWGVDKASILKSSTEGDYAKRLDRGFEMAKAAMLSRNPGAGGGSGAKGAGGQFVAESYLSDIFIDADIVGRYTPALGQNPELNHRLGEEQINAIKKAAMEFAKQEKFLENDDQENLNSFAEYAYRYHFLWPKKSNPNEIAYPTMGLSTYLNYMSNDVAGNIAVASANSRNSLGKLRSSYLQDFKNALQLYADNQPTYAEAVKKEIAKVDQKISDLKDFNFLAEGNNLNAQLGKTASAGLAQKSNLSGGLGINAAQKGFLNSINNLRKARQRQIAALNDYRQAMANEGNKDQAEKMAAISDKFKGQFSKGITDFKGADSSSNGSRENNPSFMNNDTLGSNLSRPSQFDGDKGAGGTGGLYGWGNGNSNGSASNNSGASGPSAGISQSDQNKLTNAIEERNKLDKGQYQSREGQTLFEKVTNAYIRNYDRLLREKVSKEAIE